MDHIDAMDDLREGIHLRAYGGDDPLREYQFEGYEMFNAMIDMISEEVTLYLSKAHIEGNEEREEVVQGQISTNAADDDSVAKTPIKNESKIGRNDPCTCGSGKKYKQCCGRS